MGRPSSEVRNFHCPSISAADRGPPPMTRNMKCGLRSRISLADEATGSTANR